jgi:hypothetical protein
MSDIIISQTFQDAEDLKLAQFVGDLLDKHYPGWLWAVEINDHGPLIRLLDAPVQGMCWYINPKDINSNSPEWFTKHVMLGGGEFLERSGAKRGKKTESDQIDVVEGVEVKLYTDPWAKLKAQKQGKA